jgi:hypothetical protein
VSGPRDGTMPSESGTQIGEVSVANRGSGDRPLTDLPAHGLRVYGPEADHLIRAVAELRPLREGHARGKVVIRVEN